MTFRETTGWTAGTDLTVVAATPRSELPPTVDLTKEFRFRDLVEVAGVAHGSTDVPVKPVASHLDTKPDMTSHRTYLAPLSSTVSPE